MPRVSDQAQSPGQTEMLSTDRVSSTIAKGGTEGSKWVYPSAQMFYNALARKNKLGDTSESDIPSVVALHNNMNEGTWYKILEWEDAVAPSTGGKMTTKLLKFLGRPGDLSPKALLKHYLFNHPLPFDRHDWTIQRENGEEVRYVIDYYHDESQASEEEGSGMPDLDDREAVKSILLDVRPAVDSVWNGILGQLFIMPYKVYKKETNFQFMALRPTKEMTGQVEESLKVFQGIQADGEQKRLQSETQQQQPHIEREDAIILVRKFAIVLKECEGFRKMMNECQDEEEYAQASLGLTMCMGKWLCPLQYGNVKDSLEAVKLGDQGLTEEQVKERDARVDNSLQNITLCVQNANSGLGIARKEYPDIFS